MNRDEARTRRRRRSPARREAVPSAASIRDLDELERELLGKSSPLNDVREAIKSLEPAERPLAGKAVGATGRRHRARGSAARRRWPTPRPRRSAERDRLDLTLGGRGRRRGHLHPVTRIWRELEDVFVGLGYKVAEGPEVETDWYNFEALNFPPGHPARAMQDTLYVKLGASPKR